MPSPLQCEAPTGTSPALLPARRRRLRLLLALVAATPALLWTAPASAHPFGPPQTVEVALGKDRVEVRWRAGAADDLTLLAAALGVLPADRVLLDGAVVPDDDDARQLAASPLLADYLLERVAVSVAGRQCPGALEAVDALATDGVLLGFDCGGPVTSASVTVRTLTDLHEAYRTLASGPAGQRAVYDAEHDTHEWSPGAAASGGSGSDRGRSAAVQLGGLAGLGLLGGFAAVLAGRHRRPSTRGEA